MLANHNFFGFAHNGIIEQNWKLAEFKMAMFELANLANI